MGTVITFRLPGAEPRRQLAERRTDVTRIDSRRSLIDPTRRIYLPVYAQPKIYDQDLEGE